MTDRHGQFHLRLAVPADALLLARIHRQARITAMPWLPALHTSEDDLAWMTNIVLPQQEVWVAGDGDPTGFIALSESEVEHLYVDPAAWRMGAGSALLDRAKERRPGGFRLWTFQRNAMARAFYRKHDLVELRTTDGSGNEENEPDVQLGWKLTST
jgi:GNAT superfamily N-acetyltransferase